MIGYFVIGVAAYAIGIIVGNGGVNRKPAQMIPAARLYVAFSKSERKS